MTRPDTSLLKRLLASRVLLLDGSTGVELQKKNISEREIRGSRFASHPLPLTGNFDILNLTEPGRVAEVHRAYLKAGADIIETNTFNSNALSQKDYATEAFVEELNYEGARIARMEADAFMKADGRPRFVAGAMGPTPRAASLSPDVNDPAARSTSYTELADAYEMQARGLIRGGADLLLIETIFDALNAKAAIEGVRRANATLGASVPFILSITVAPKSFRMLSGHSPEAFLATIKTFSPLAVGFNCSAGPAGLAATMRDFAAISPFPTIFYPNAGLPDEMGEYTLTPDDFAEAIRPLAAQGILNIVGGCCGTTPGHIGRLRQIADAAAPHRPVTDGCSHLWLAGTEPFHDDRGFINIGERCNVAGSRRFLRLVSEGNYSEAVDIARRQVEDGARILDINMDDGLLDSAACMRRFTRLLAADPLTASVPWMIDSSSFDVIEEALRNVPGKAIVNSISLKHGPEMFLNQARAIAGYGAAMVVMLFDERGQATSFSRKIEIAGRAFRLLTAEGIPAADIIIDPNVLTVSTGMKEHDSLALDYIRAVEWITENLPGAKTSGGISNLSFAFRGNNFLRRAMHAVFLYHAVRAGLSMAIMDPSSRVGYEDVPSGLRGLIEDVVLLRRDDASGRLIEAAPGYAAVKGAPEAAEQMVPGKPLPLDRRLSETLVRGDDSCLETDLREALSLGMSPSAIINGPLMKGMECMGALFQEGKVFLPQVVKCARTMRRAVDILTPFMEGGAEETSSRGRFLLATVKGDVHDIGKNIAAVVLRCNGFDVIDLGVQVDATALLEAVRTENPDFIGLSGLISPSLGEMTAIATRLREAGVSVPLMVGGAATSPLHTALRIAPAYAPGVVIHVRDASRNPLVAFRFIDDPAAAACDVKAAHHTLVEKYRQEKTARENASAAAVPAARKVVVPSPRPSFLGIRTLPPVPLSEVRGFVNFRYLYNCWKVREGSPEADALRKDAEKLLDSLQAQGATLLVQAAFHEARADDSAIHAGHVSIPTPRQTPRPGRTTLVSLCDFVAPADDYIGCFMITVGTLIREKIEEARSSGDDYRLLLLQSVADRLAEAGSEWLHREVRTKLWGYAPDENLSREEILQGRYQGIRPAIGYPSLPDQMLMHRLARLLDPASLSVSLTPNGALSPSSTVAGLYLASPLSRYFTL